MENRPKIECDIHDFLDRANVILLLGVSEEAREIIPQLRDCANQADAAGYKDSALRLRDVADTLERKLLSASVNG